MIDKTLIIGYGQIGKGLAKILLRQYEVNYLDIKNPIDISSLKFDTIHICFGWNDNFDKEVNYYLKVFDPKICFIHSTVSPKTKLIDNPKVVFSPVRGIHPNLSEGIETFLKYIGCKNLSLGMEAEKFLNKVGIKTQLVSSKEAIFAKLIDTTYYGACIAFSDFVDKTCKENNIDYDRVYTQYNLSYNAGYQQLGLNRVVRPTLYPPTDKIGGHCVTANSEILSEFIDSPFLDMIQDLNKTFNQK